MTLFITQDFKSHLLLGFVFFGGGAHPIPMVTPLGDPGNVVIGSVL